MKADPEVLQRLDRIAELLEKQLTKPARPSRPRVVKTVNSSRVDTSGYSVSKPVSKPAEVEKVQVAAPSKAELCRQWFAEHPEDLTRTNRDLAANVRPMGVVISQGYWGRVKKELTE